MYYCDTNDDNGNRLQLVDLGGGYDNIHYETVYSYNGNFTVDIFISATYNINYYVDLLYQLDRLS